MEVAFLISLIQICMTLAGAWRQGGSACNICKLDKSHSSSYSSSEKVLWKRFPILPWVKTAYFLSVKITTCDSGFNLSTPLNPGTLDYFTSHLTGRSVRKGQKYNRGITINHLLGKYSAYWPQHINTLCKSYSHWETHSEGVKLTIICNYSHHHYYHYYCLCNKTK